MSCYFIGCLDSLTPRKSQHPTVSKTKLYSDGGSRLIRGQTEKVSFVMFSYAIMYMCKTFDSIIELFVTAHHSSAFKMRFL